jgi:hypothetical protein
MPQLLAHRRTGRPMTRRGKSPALRSRAAIAAILASALSPVCLGQAAVAGPQIKQEAKTATCSNVVVTGGTAKFQCSGLTAEQAKLLKEMPSLLSRILESEHNDTAEILSRLNTCVDQGAGRVLTPEMQEGLKTLLQLTPGTLLFVKIYAANGTPESIRYAEQIRKVFADAGWVTSPVARSMSFNAPTKAITVMAHDELSIPVQIVHRAFSGRFPIETVYQLNTTEAEDSRHIAISVGQQVLE